MDGAEGTAKVSSGNRRHSHIHGHYAVRHSCARRPSRLSMDVNVGQCIVRIHVDPGMNFNDLLAVSLIMAMQHPLFIIASAQVFDMWQIVLLTSPFPSFLWSYTQSDCVSLGKAPDMGKVAFAPYGKSNKDRLKENRRNFIDASSYCVRRSLRVASRMETQAAPISRLDTLKVHADAGFQVRSRPSPRSKTHSRTVGPTLPRRCCPRCPSPEC